MPSERPCARLDTTRLPRCHPTGSRSQQVRLLPRVRSDRTGDHFEKLRRRTICRLSFGRARSDDPDEAEPLRCRPSCAERGYQDRMPALEAAAAAIVSGCISSAAIRRWLDETEDHQLAKAAAEAAIRIQDDELVWLALDHALADARAAALVYLANSRPDPSPVRSYRGQRAAPSPQLHSAGIGPSGRQAAEACP